LHAPSGSVPICFALLTPELTLAFQNPILTSGWT
jgi:hypothetical protein